MRYVRITCVPVEASEEQQMLIDAIIDDQNNICGEHALFGLWGRLNHEQDHFSPFVLKSDGQLIYDDFIETENRYWHLSLREGEIIPGRLVSYECRASSYQASYRIQDVLPLPVPSRVK